MANHNALSLFTFAAEPGFHHLTVRTESELIQIDSVSFEKGKKTIVSLARDSKDKRVTREGSIQDKYPLSSKEKDMLFRHSLIIQSNDRKRFSVEQGNKSFEIERYWYSSLLGPILEDSVTILAKNERYNFLFEPGYVYQFGKGQVFKKQQSEARMNFSPKSSFKFFDFLPSEGSKPKAIQDNNFAIIEESLVPDRLKAASNQGILTVFPPLQKK